MVLLALVVALTAELIRFAGPQFDFLLGSGGVGLAAVMSVVTYSVPAIFTAIFLLGRKPSGVTVLASVVSLVAARLALQWLDGLALTVVGLVAVSIAVSATVIVAAVASRFGGIVVARGVGGGLFLSAAISLVLTTFDSVWQSTFLGMLPVFLLAIGAITLAVLARNVHAESYSRGLWTLGPVLSMGTTVFANPAFISSQSGTALWVSAVALLLGLLLTTILLRSRQQPTLLLAIAAILSTATVYFVPGWPQQQTALVSIIVVLFAAIVGASFIGLLAVATERSTPRDSATRLSWTAAGGGLLVILPTLLFQLDYDIPLPFPNEFIMVGLAAIIALHVLYVARMERREGFQTSTLDVQASSPFAQLVHVGSTFGIAVLTIIGAIVVMPKLPNATTADIELTPKVLSWNVHYGVSLDGAITIDDMAAYILDSGADIVALQEISRGWIMGGGGDQLTYLANKLGMEYAFVGAADNQFGNALMWSLRTPLEDITRTDLTYGDGPQHRSAIAGVLKSHGFEATIANAHLQHRDSNTPTRMLQIADMFEGLNISEQALVVGDFNAEPGWPEIKHFESLGFVSAVDAAGDPNSLTFPADDPQIRIDWMFARGLNVNNATVTGNASSDHLPLAVEISLP